jgi:hypothetical protein
VAGPWYTGARPAGLKRTEAPPVEHRGTLAALRDIVLAEFELVVGWARPRVRTPCQIGVAERTWVLANEVRTRPTAALGQGRRRPL